MNPSLVRKIGNAFAQSQRVLVVSHIRPDGDAVGSLLGLGLALQQAGKEVQMVLSDGVPTSFRFLEGSGQVVNQPEGKFDLIAVVDCSELGRAGNAPNGVLKPGTEPDINIDHHITNLNFARLNLVVNDAAATAEVLARLLPQVGLSITPAVANALMAGLIADTLGFRVASVTPNVMRLAADLMEAGANLFETYQHTMLDRSFAAARYWGSGLSTLQRDGRMVWATLTLAHRKAVNYPGRDDADLINVVSSITEADISLVFVEQKDGRVKVSWRSKPGYDVSQVALQFGGGGHTAASGADISGELIEVQQAVLGATRKLLP
jgi:phosphoesterase RecJ-like protein